MRLEVRAVSRPSSASRQARLGASEEGEVLMSLSTTLQWLAALGFAALVFVALSHRRRSNLLDQQQSKGCRKTAGFWGNLKQACKHFGNTGDLPGGAQVPMHIGQKAKALAARGDLQAAVKVYEDFLCSKPDSALALNNAACFCLKMENPKKARHFLERAVRVDPHYAQAWCNLAEAKLMDRDFGGAADDFRTALKYEPTSITARIAFARLFLDKWKNGQRACELLEEASRLDGRNAAVWMNLGFARMMLGNLTGAKESFERALKHDRKMAAAKEGLKQAHDLALSAARMERVGGVFRSGEGTVYSTHNAKVICTDCGAAFNEYGQTTLDNRAQGGLRCRSCGRFYCEPCVGRVVFNEASRGRICCECGASTAILGNTGEWTYQNFDELVVFRSS